MKRGKFERLIRTHTKEKVAGGAAMLAAGVVVAEVRHKRSRSQHFHELQTLANVADVNERADEVFAFDDTDPNGVNLAVYIADRVRAAAPPRGVSGGLTAEELAASFTGQTDEQTLFDSLQDLITARFIAIEPLQSGKYGYCPTSELDQVIADGNSAPLAQLAYGGYGYTAG